MVIYYFNISFWTFTTININCHWLTCVRVTCIITTKQT